MTLKRISIIFVCLLFLLNSAGCGADKDEISLRNESEYVTEAYSQPESTTINENEAEFPDESVSAEESASADISKASDKSTLSDTHTNTPTEAKTQADTKASSEINSSGWAEAYRAYLLELTKVYIPESGNRFALIFIDSDNIPELVVTDGPSAHGYGYTVLVYKNGKAVESSYLGTDSFWYYPKKSIFGQSGSGGAGSGGKTFYRLEGTQSIANPSTFRDQFKEALEGVEGVRILTPHCCRHTYVSQLQAAGTDIDTIRILSGHAQIEMTQHYLHVQENVKEDAVKALDLYFAS